MRLSPRAYQRLTLVAVIALAGIIVSGAAVRLTGSGLGCPNWPTCAHGRVVPPVAFHPWVEFGNRIVTGFVSAAVALAVLGSLVRVPRRRDLTLLSAGLVAGVATQIVLGGLAVLYKLAPPFVMAHFLLSMAILANAVILHDHAGRPLAAVPQRVVPPDLVRLGRLMALVTVAVLTAGTVVTSTGPHGGAPSAPRWDLSLHRMTQFHGALAMLLLVLVVTTLGLLWLNGAPALPLQRARLVLEALVAQIAIGYAQYFTGVPAVLVGFHVLGAVLMWVAVLRYNSSLVVWRPAPVLADVSQVAMGLAHVAAGTAAPREMPV